MTTIITRLYPSRKQATAVVNALKAEEFSDSDIDVITHTAKEDSKPDMSAIGDRIRAARVYPSAAAAYAGRVATGDALVVLRAPIGQSVRARSVIDRFPAIDAGVKHAEYYAGTSNQLSTRSSRRHLPELLHHNQKMMSGDSVPGLTRSSTPFSSMFGLPLLTGREGRKTRLITRRTTPFSSTLGLGLLVRQWPHARLVNNSTPFSSMFGLPTLTKRR